MKNIKKIIVFLILIVVVSVTHYNETVEIKSSSPNWVSNSVIDLKNLQTINLVDTKGYAWYKEATNDTPYGNLDKNTLILDGINVLSETNYLFAYILATGEIAEPITVIIADDSVNNLEANYYDSKFFHVVTDITFKGQIKGNGVLNAEVTNEATYGACIYSSKILTFEGGIYNFLVNSTNTNSFCIRGVREIYFNGGTIDAEVTNGSVIRNYDSISLKPADIVFPLNAVYTNGLIYESDGVTLAKKIKLIYTKVESIAVNDGGSLGESIDIGQDGRIVRPPNPTKEGYKFIGWYSNIGHTKEFDFSQIVTPDTILYGKWQKLDLYSVVFNTDGGSFIETIVIEKNGFVARPIDPTKEGNKFIGWYKEPSHTSQWNFSTDKVTMDTTLYAKWEESSYKIIFEGNQGESFQLNLGYSETWKVTDNGFSSSYKIVFDYQTKMDKNKINIINHTFAGWSLSLGGEVKYKVNDTISSLSSINNGVVRLYAVFLPQSFVIDEPSKIGSKFLYWAYDKEGKEHAFNANEEITPTSDLLLYAIWERDKTLDFLTDEEYENATSLLNKNEDGTYIVNGKYSSNDVYLNQKEAFEAAVGDYKKESASTNATDFASDLFGNADKFNTRVDEAILSIKGDKEEGYKIAGSNKIYSTLEDALSEVLIIVKTQVLEEKKEEISTDITNHVRGCDGDNISLAAAETIKKVNEVELSESTVEEIFSVYEAALATIRQAQEIQKLLNKMTDDCNKATANKELLQLDVDNLIAFYQEQSLLVIDYKTLEEIENFIRVWNRKLENLRVYALEDHVSSVGSISSNTGFSANTNFDFTLSNKKIEIDYSKFSIKSSEKSLKKILKLIKKLETLQTYGIQITQKNPLSNSSISLHKEITKYEVSIKIPQEYKLYTDFCFVAVDEDGNTEYYDAKVVDGYLVFETDKLADFTLLAKKPTRLEFIFIPLAIFIVLGVGYALVCKKEVESCEQN